MPRVLITGAAGFIGMHTSIRFLQEGWYVIGLDNMNEYYSVMLKRDRIIEIQKQAELSNGDFVLWEKDLNSDVWNDLKDLDFDVVIHLAAQAGVRYSIENPRAYIESNILGFQSVLEFVESKKIKKFLYASSSSVYGKDSISPFNELESCNKPESYYAATKKANELMAYSYYKTKGIISIGMRFFTVYGPWGRPDMAPLIFTKAAFDKETISVFNYGKQKRDFTYIDDVVEGIMLLSQLRSLKSTASIVNIGKGSPVRLLEFISLLEKYTNHKIEKEFVKAQPGDVAVTFSDTSELMQLVDYEPKVEIQEGLLKTVEWYKKYYLE